MGLSSGIGCQALLSVVNNNCDRSNFVKILFRKQFNNICANESENQVIDNFHEISPKCLKFRCFLEKRKSSFVASHNYNRMITLGRCTLYRSMQMCLLYSYKASITLLPPPPFLQICWRRRRSGTVLELFLASVVGTYSTERPLIRDERNSYGRLLHLFAKNKETPLPN